jgi:hypothetical protein
MARPGESLRNLLVWTYERGTLQYDIICGLILAFVFLVPKGCFVHKSQNDLNSQVTQTSHFAPLAGQPSKSAKTARIYK